MPGAVMASESLIRHYLMPCCSGMELIIYIVNVRGK